MDTKKCNTCGEVKSLDLFYNDKKSKDKRCHSCKKCMNLVTYRNYQKKRKPRPDWSTEEGFKICRKCLLKKPVSEFNIHYGKTSTKDKLRNECRECQRQHSKEHYNEHKDEINAVRRYEGKHNKKVRRERHNFHLRRKFGIGADEYDRMLLDQGGKCAICGTDKPGINGNTIKNFAVDHNHETGKIRSLLCANCNQGLGNFLDSPTLLRTAAEYLENH